MLAREPLPARAGDPAVLPDRIVIYAELAHAFGWDDRLIRRHGY